jgi:N-acetylmuramoyl-L-alanine amidase
MDIARLLGKLSPNDAIQQESERRNGMDIIMTRPDDEKYQIIRPDLVDAPALEKRSAFDVIMTRPDDERYNVIRP